MNKDELVNFLKKHLKINLFKEKLFSGNICITADLTLQIDGEEIEIDSDNITI